MGRRTEDIDDAEVIAACCNGESSAFGILVRRHQQAMFNIAFRITGDYDDACDVVQDSFVAAYKALSSFRGTGRFSTWLTSITLNHCRNHLTQKKSLATHHSPQSTGGAGPAVAVEDIPCSAPSALDLLEKQAVHDRVRSCIAGLPVDFREVLVLRDLQEYSYEEVGHALQIQEGTVKSRLFRAREAIKDCLKRILREL